MLLFDYLFQPIKKLGISINWVVPFVTNSIGFFHKKKKKVVLIIFNRSTFIYLCFFRLIDRLIKIGFDFF